MKYLYVEGKTSPDMTLCRSLRHQHDFRLHFTFIMRIIGRISPNIAMANIDREKHAPDLQEVEPSPVEETPLESKHGYFPPSSTPPEGTYHLGLHSQHSSIWWLTRIQKYSSYAFSAFAAA